MIRPALGASCPLDWQGRVCVHVCEGHTQAERQKELLRMRITCSSCDCYPHQLWVPASLLLTPFQASPKQLLHRLRAQTLVSTKVSRHSLGRCEEWILSHSCPHLLGTQREAQRAGSCPVWRSWVIQKWFLPPASPNLCQRWENNENNNKIPPSPLWQSIHD